MWIDALRKTAWGPWTAIATGSLMLMLAVPSGVLAQSDSSQAPAEAAILESPVLKLQVETATGRWSLLDKRSGVRWPTLGTASAGEFTPPLASGFDGRETSADGVVLSQSDRGLRVAFQIIDAGHTLQFAYKGFEQIDALGDALVVTADEQGYLMVPCREGLLIPANSGVAFQRAFGTSEYEGCHMNMLGLLKSNSGLIVAWDDAYVTPELSSVLPQDAASSQQLVTRLTLRATAHVLRLTPLGAGNWNTVAAAYRQMAAERGLAVTLRDKMQRDPHVELLLGAADVKLWTCLDRKMNEESTQEESVEAHWTFDEAAQIAEHLHRDVDLQRCLFMIGGWTEGGYDCRHPDNLPANPECGGNDSLASAIERIQALGFVGCLHDNYQDMYRDARSWNPDLIEKRADGSLIQGGRWLGGRAYMVCAPNQVTLATRPENMPAIQQLFRPWSYFIDTTYAVGPRECADPQHPLDRNGDIACKIRLSDAAREQFGLFGSECGREWALPHSDFFEGLVGVSGQYYHQLDPATLGATVIPFFEMVYHDCQICFGKYGYAADKSAEYVAHHVLTARPLHYHSVPDHLYWKQPSPGAPAAPAVTEGAVCTRSDQGWAAQLHPHDVFLKNTHEVLGPLHAVTALERLTDLQFLTADRTVRRATYGDGDAATSVWVNFGTHDATVQTPRGGQVVLPAFGFVVEGPRLVAFLAKSWAGQSYPQAALFTIQPLDDQPLASAPRVRVFHGFGDPQIAWQQHVFTIPREQVIP